jgi:mono/diheme cytochrome c family protein
MIRGAAILALCVLAAGCTKSNMDSQPKDYEYRASGLFRNGRVLQEQVAGTVARGDLARAADAARKPAVTAELLARGHERYDINCSQCHDRTGRGNGMVVQRGFPQPPSLHEDRLRSADDQHFYDVITNGYGVMYSHATRVQPRDRWAIIAYVRALQLSQHATLADLPGEERAKLAGEKSPEKPQ